MRAALTLPALLLTAAACVLPGSAPADAHPGAALGATVRATTHSAAHRAPVIGHARRGGPVIIWMTDQHKGLSLRTQNAERTRLSHTDQDPVVDAIRAAGGTHVLRLISVNAVAAHVSAAEVQRLRTLPSVLRILPDDWVTIGDPETRGPQSHGRTVLDPLALKTARQHAAKSGRTATSNATPSTNPFPTVNSCGTQATPLIEPEALDTIKAPAMTDAGLATEPGHGVIVANAGISIPLVGDLVGNPNFVRPTADGGGSVVTDAIPLDTSDSTNGEYYGDASSIDAQGGVEYQYATELPYSGLPTTCYFKIVGDAPGASLVDTDLIDTPPSVSGTGTPATPAPKNRARASTLIAGTDAAILAHADVINESYGYANDPGSYASNYASNDSAVAAGVTVVVSAGDSGEQGTVSSPATDPLVIAAGATNTLRENAMAYGYTGWVNNDITALSSGGTTPNNKVVDLVAPGYGGEAACNPNGTDCPTNTQTEAFGGTSEAAPLVAGGAADVIAAYRDSHAGTSPTPAVVKAILTGTATDVHAPADQQGAGLLDIAAAVSAAQQYTGTTVTTAATHPGLVPTPTQLDVTGAGGTSIAQSLSVYNANSTATTVTGAFRVLGPETDIGSPITQNISAPDASLPIPTDGAQASPDITFTVPAGVDRLNATMIWPDASNDAILNFVLTDPQGRLRQISYDYGAAGSTPDIQRVSVAMPEAGKWTAAFKWGNGRSHLQEEPNTPGTYTGTMSFKTTGQTFTTSPASPAVTIPAHSSATVPLSIAMPTAPGDRPESVQLTSSDGTVTSVPVARRSLVPSYGGEFDTLITNTVSRGVGQISTFDVDVPAGQSDLGVVVETPDTSADDPYTLFLVNPSGTSVATSGTGGTTNGVPLATADVNGVPMQTVTYHEANPAAGTWEIDVELNLTTSGKEFEQTVVGDILAQAPVISAPATGATAPSQTPMLSGTGAPDHTVTVVAGGKTVCTAAVKADGTWSCVAATQPQGSETFTATQADTTGFASAVSTSVALTIPAAGTLAPTTISLAASPMAPAAHQADTLTATTGNVPDGTTATFEDGSTVLGTGPVSDGVATLALPDGFAVGDHQLTASVPVTASSQASTSSVVDIVIAKSASTIELALGKSRVPYGTAVKGAVHVEGATGGTATVTYASASHSVALNGSGVGRFTLPASLAVGNHTVTAAYAGSDTLAASPDVSVVLKTTKHATTVALRVARAKVGHGKHDTVTVKVSGHTGAAYPVGRIKILALIGGHGRTTYATLTQAEHGALTFRIAMPTRVGKVRITAKYLGNASFTVSTSKVKAARTT